MKKQVSLVVQDTEIVLLKIKEEDYISLTDIANKFGDGLIENWLRNRDTVEFLGVWERINNPDFNSLEFEGIKNDAGANRFSMSVKKWVTKTKAIGIVAKTGRYGGTYAHKDIALEFCSWLSPEFKLYLIKEFQKLKEYEQAHQGLQWDLRRELSRINYKIHTDAVRTNLIPPNLSSKQQSFVYAGEADILNMALFGTTAKEWRKANPKIEGNIRDHVTIEQLIVLSNLESINAVMIHEGKIQSERLQKLNEIARRQIKALLSGKTVERHALN
jgi:hypothetical protein